MGRPAHQRNTDAREINLTSMDAARQMLTGADDTLTRAQAKIMAAADSEINEAKELVRSVFAAGYELPGLNEVIGMIEVCGNEAHALIGKLQACRTKIDEVKGS